MRFSFRHLVVIVGCFGVSLALATVGHHLMGWWGVLAVGVSASLASLLLYYLVAQWQQTPLDERLMLCLGMIVCICGGVFLCHVALENGMLSWREQIREVSRLESALHKDKRFSCVLVSCEGVAAGRWLCVRGVVQSQTDLDDLHKRLDDIKVKWPVYCHVELSALFIPPRDEPWKVSASGDDGRVRVTVTIYRDTVAPGEVAGIRATFKVLVDGPLRFPQDYHQPLAFLYLRTPAGQVIVYPQRGVNPQSCRALALRNYRRSVGVERGFAGPVIEYDAPMVSPSPGWLEPRTYESLRPNLRIEGVYEAWVRYTIPRIKGVPSDAWHGTVETDRIRFTVREVPVADRRAEPTAEQIAHLEAYVEYLDALSSGKGVEPARLDTVEMPQWLSLPDRLQWAFERTENEGLAHHAVALLREHLPKDESQPYPKWWDNVRFLVQRRAFLNSYRTKALKIVGPYLDEYATVAADAFERDIASLTERSFSAGADLNLLVAFVELKPKSSIRQRLEAIARRHAKIPVGVKPRDRIVRNKLVISWKILYALEILREEMPFTEATNILGEPTVRKDDLVAWNYTTGSRGLESGVNGKLIFDGVRVMVVFTNRGDWTD
jgi:hypothetical protein